MNSRRQTGQQTAERVPSTLRQRLIATQGAVVVAAFLTICGCGPATTETLYVETPLPTVDAGTEWAAAIPPPEHVDPAFGKVPEPVPIVRVGVKFSIAPRPRGGKGDVSAIYKKVAPAVVIISTADGMGSGVVFRKDGWVLTNHHVVESARKEDFVGEVDVQLGKLGKQGAMELSGEKHEAVVYAFDPELDLAVIKIVDPPADLQHVEIATEAPPPGTPVAKIGHPSNGLLWAINDCQISGVGTLQEGWAALKGAEMSAGTEEVAAKLGEFAAKHPGKAYQTNCDLAAGDSGGPLVDYEGRIVGLNAFGFPDPKTGRFSSFHVHLSEIRDFLKHVPAKPRPMTPDPWLAASGTARYDDADVDGAADMLIVRNESSPLHMMLLPRAYFIDLDQDSFEKGEESPPPGKVYRQRSFDAEVIALSGTEDGVLVWYDTDMDGTMDRLLVDENGNGRADRAYLIEEEGALEQAKQLEDTDDFSAGLFEDGGFGERLSRIAAVWFVGDDGASPLPNPLAVTGRDVAARDIDSNGKVDTLTGLGAFSVSAIIDADENAFTGYSDGDVVTGGFEQGGAGVEVALVQKGPEVWLWYDTDEEVGFDMALYSSDRNSGCTSRAFSIASDGEAEEIEGQLGRLLLRPGLLTAEDEVKRARAIMSKITQSLMIAGDDRAGSFPDPKDAVAEAKVSDPGIKGWRGSVAMLDWDGAFAVLVDVDQSARKAGHRDAVEAVEQGVFSADLAYFAVSSASWSRYDTDFDGSVDLVLFSGEPKGGKASAAYRISRDGEVALDAALFGGPMVRADVLKKKRYVPKLKKVAKAVFSEALIGP